jgi:hypothetical protein
MGSRLYHKRDHYGRLLLIWVVGLMAEKPSVSSPYAFDRA